MKTYQQVGFFTGIILFLIVLLMPTPAGLSVEAQRIIAMALLMISWWGTEAVPIAVTSVIPMTMLPLLGIYGKKAAELKINAFTQYASPTVILIGAILVMAGAMVKWNLHKRIALNIVVVMGSKPSRILFGFIMATAFVSMFMSNTTATAMMIPIALALVAQIGLDKSSPFSKALCLSIPYAASLGGIGTVIGTSTNITGVGLMRTMNVADFSFFEWMKIGVPFVVCIVPLLWLFMVWFFKCNKTASVESDVIKKELDALGPMNKGELYTAIIFTVVILLLATRVAWKSWAPGFNDTIISMVGLVAMFVIPVDWKKGVFVLDMKTALANVSLPTCLLVGGALTLGNAIAKAGIATWMAEGLGFLQGVPPLAVVLFVGVVAAIITEFTTNVVVVAAFLPMLYALANQLGMPPLVLMVTCTVASSFAFMLPSGTPPNAVAYGSGAIEMKDLIKTGFGVKIVCIVAFPVVFYLFTMPLLGM